MNNPPLHPPRGYTLVELSIAMGMIGVVGLIIYTVLNGGMVLFSKNVATNYSNLTVGGAAQRMIQDLHESIGRAELVGSNLQPVAGESAVGVRFPLLLNEAAVRVISDNSGNTTINSVSSTDTVSLRISLPPVVPKTGDIFILPDINDRSGNALARTIISVSVGNPTVVTVKDLGINLNISTDTPPDPTIAYIARLAAYSLVTTATDSAGLPYRTELRFYPDAGDTTRYSVITHNIATYLPALTTGDYQAPFGSGSVAPPVGPFSFAPSGTSFPENSIFVQMMSINADTGRRSFSGDRMLLSQIIPPKALILQSTNYN